MTGQDLRAIRLLNGITQQQIAEKVGYSTRDTIRKYENSEFLPHKFVLAISELVGFDFTNDKKQMDYVSKIPKDVHNLYKVPKRRNLFFGI